MTARAGRGLALTAALWLLGGCAANSGGGDAMQGCGGDDGTICTYMGTGEAALGMDGLPPLEVALYLPQDLTFGPDGKPYVLDWNNHRVRTVTDGKVETIIGTGELGDAPDGPALRASLNHPTHVSFDDQGRLIMSAWHNSKVMRYDFSTKLLTTLCGDGKRDYGGDDGPASKAILDLPTATAFDSQGRMLIMDQGNQRIRRVDENDIITTIVGPNKDFEPMPDGLEKVCADDPDTGAQSCKLCLPAEAADPMCTAQKPQGFAGDGGPATQALMYQRYSQAADPEGRMEIAPDDTLYFCDTGNNRVRAVSPDGIITTVAGSGPDHYDPTFKGGYSGDGGPATEALLKNPIDVAVGKNKVLFIADTQNSCVRKVDTKGIISTIAGKCGKRGFAGDGGPASKALLDRPYGVTLDKHGNLYIADTHNHRIRVVYGVE